MYNIFENSKKLLDSIKRENRNYWDPEPKFEWNRAAKAPDDSTYDEEAMMESIRQSDIKRLLKFG